MNSPILEPLEPRTLLSQGSLAPPLASTAPPRVTVMTQNLYSGGAFDESTLSLSGGSSILPDLDRVRQTNFPQRAKAIAREVYRVRPDLIALQEAVIWRSGTVFSPARADHVEYDFTRILLNALRARGLNYRAVSKSTNADIEVPGFADGHPRDVRMTDQDVILARSDSKLKLFHERHGNFEDRLEVPAPVLGHVDMKRGWASVDAQIGGRTFRFIDTHLEAFSGTVRREQARELLDGPARTRLPVILAGDFNAGPVVDSGTYNLLLDDGFADAWRQSRPDDAGFTFGQAPNLRNRHSQLSARIDLILLGGRVRAARTELVGDDEGDRTPSGLWPSDHAGVVARVELAAPRLAQANRSIGLFRA